MKNLWPEEFKPNENKSPKQILNEQSLLLPKLTGDMVLAGVKDMSEVDAMMKSHKNDFSYSFYLSGKFLKNYSFKVFDISHAITFYPVKVTVDEKISQEIGLVKNATLNNEEELLKLFEAVFKSDHLKRIIGSIIQISGKT